MKSVKQYKNKNQLTMPNMLSKSKFVLFETWYLNYEVNRQVISLTAYYKLIDKIKIHNIRLKRNNLHNRVFKNKIIISKN
jgi:hypothetical protein